MANPPVRVVKLGGSLLAWPPCVERVRSWLARQPPAANVVVVGGGAVVDALRALDRAHTLPTETAHWLAVRAMSLTAAVAAELWPEARSIAALDELDAARSDLLQILDVERFLRQDREASDALPIGWDVTSDSIAARIARALEARELVLLKSAPPPPDDRRETWAAAGRVDACFARAAAGLTVYYVDLRDPAFARRAAR